ncbi:unnamed protein product [Paramecium pentaurelia]|uniref:Uncharacterized protein n=1 Tax=Paramecium pentaurelia TaxID=43138 RepID=A0A8S1W7J4_9CILI|nr:unnamed protein product [Paramecium pentaurelia]
MEFICISPKFTIIFCEQNNNKLNQKNNYFNHFQGCIVHNDQCDHLYQNQFEICKKSKPLFYIKAKDTVIDFAVYKLKLEQQKFIITQGSFQGKEALVDTFCQVQDVNQQNFAVILEILRKEKVQDCIEYLSYNRNTKHYKQQIFKDDNIKPFDMWWKLDVVTTNIMKISNILKLIKVHDYNQLDYSTEENEELQQHLIKRFNENRNNLKIHELIKLNSHTRSVQSVLMEIHQHLVVVITLSVQGMSKQDKKFHPLIKTKKIFLLNQKYHL